MADDKRDNLIQITIVLIVAVTGLAIIFGLLGGGLTGGGMMGGMMGFGGLFMLIPVVFVILLIYALVDRDRPTYLAGTCYEIENPTQVLEHRYARGELSREDYLRMRDDLSRRY
jgi:putative membrane protein